MNVHILASGSNANCYAFCDEAATVQIECGLPVGKTFELLNWKLPDAVLVTHEHQDHARATEGFLKRGVDVYMTAGTRDALKLKTRHNLHTIEVFKQVMICGHSFLPIPTKHDAAEPVCFLVDSEIFVVTDTGEVPNVTGKFHKVYIEANYSTPMLAASDVGEAQRQRIIDNHLSITQVKEFLRGLDELPNAVHLLHISKRHGDGAEFVRQVKRATGLERVKAH